MCLGYLDDPAANAELFTADGFVLHADVAEVDAEGYLSVVGRKSYLIIRGGKNISAREVEDEVAAHPRVALAAAVPVPDPVFGERVCGGAAHFGECAEDAEVGSGKQDRRVLKSACHRGNCGGVGSHRVSRNAMRAERSPAFKESPNG